jgi:DNA-binding transcriptional regulator YiaG
MAKLKVQKPRPVQQMDLAEWNLIRSELGEGGKPYPITYLALALGVNVSTIYRWEDGSRPICARAGKLMRLFREAGWVF